VPYKNHPDHRLASLHSASPVCGVVRQVPRTASYFIPSAMTGFIVSVFPFRNRVSSKEAFEGLELGEGRPSRPVLRGPGGRKAAWILGNYLIRRTTETGLARCSRNLDQRQRIIPFPAAHRRGPVLQWLRRYPWRSGLESYTLRAKHEAVSR